MKNVGCLTLLFVACIVWFGHAKELFDYDPVANPEAVIRAGQARFTILTAGLIRMEYVADAHTPFEERATMAFVNRNVPLAKFSVSNDSTALNITTQRFQLTYHFNMGPFTADSLQIRALDAKWSMFDVWSPGMPNPGNLPGTIRSLDELGVISLNCTENANTTVHDEQLHCQWGLISRNGWVVVDDSDNYALDSSEWWSGKNTDTQDWYFFGHGLDYRTAIMDYTLVGGQVSMVPRYATGIWWTRWYNFDNLDVRKVVEDYASRSLPLDVFVLDMDWHTKNDWGGYTWDARLFPNPSDTLAYMHQRGLHVAANIHDDTGVGPWEDTHTAMANALGLDPATCGLIKFDIINKSYAMSLEDVVLQRREKEGMDFWWIDWQQGGTQGGCAGGSQNPTILLNYLRSTDALRRSNGSEPSTRGLVLGRWGGLGNHRYQVGFSGDVAGLTWDNLAFQPYFSSAAANVGYGFWSHDLVGPAQDHEMYVRWIQWGSVSAIFRTHDRGMSAGGCVDSDPSTCATVRMWEVPTRYFEINRASVTARAQLVPYLYSAHYEAFVTGVSIVRPMYYDYPIFEMAYASAPDGSFSQYFLGPNLMCAPVVKQADVNGTDMATTSVWIPPNVWTERDTGVEHDGGSIGAVLTKAYDLSEIPVFVRAGAIIPQIPVVTGDTLGLAARQYTTLVLSIYPGSSDSSTSVYEDDGSTTAYATGVHALTYVSYARAGSSLTVSVSTSGSYPELPSERSIVLRIVNSLPATGVSVSSSTAKDSSVALTYSRFGGADTFSYDGPEASAVVELGPRSVAGGVKVTVDFMESDSASVLNGLKGALRHATLAKRLLDAERTTPGAHSVTGGNISVTASIAEELSVAASDAATFNSILKSFPDQYQLAVNEIKAMTGNAQRLAYANALLSSVYVKPTVDDKPPLIPEYVNAMRRS